MRAFCAWNSSSVSTPRARRSASRSSSVVTEGESGAVPTAAASGRDGRRGRGVGRRPLARALLVQLPLMEDRALHVLGVADVLERVRAGGAGRLDQQGAGPHDAVEDALLEPHVVDLLERDLHRPLRDESLAADHAVGRDHEDRRPPGHELRHDEPQHQREPGRPHDPDDHTVEPVQDPDGRAGAHDRGERGGSERHGVRPELEHHLFAGDQQLAREHARDATRAPGRPQTASTSAQVLDLLGGHGDRAVDGLHDEPSERVDRDREALRAERRRRRSRRPAARASPRRRSTGRSPRRPTTRAALQAPAAPARGTRRAARPGRDRRGPSTPRRRAPRGSDPSRSRPIEPRAPPPTTPPAPRLPSPRRPAGRWATCSERRGR